MGDQPLKRGRSIVLPANLRTLPLERTPSYTHADDLASRAARRAPLCTRRSYSLRLQEQLRTEENAVDLRRTNGDLGHNADTVRPNSANANATK